MLKKYYIIMRYIKAHKKQKAKKQIRPTMKQQQKVSLYCDLKWAKCILCQKELDDILNG